MAIATAATQTGMNQQDAMADAMLAIDEDIPAISPESALLNAYITEEPNARVPAMAYCPLESTKFIGLSRQYA